MLKIIGASSEQTKLTSFLLAIVIIVAIVSVIFLEVPYVNNDGYYAATVYWSPGSNFRVSYWGQNNDPTEIKQGVARAYYKPDAENTGWASLEIQTDNKYPDWVQAYAAGLLEGSLCWQMIYWHWQNTVAETCKGREEFCNNMRHKLEENANKVRKEASEKDTTDPYWHQVNLFYVQLDGLEEGWKNGVVRSRKNKIISIPHIDFLWMNSASDLRDLAFQHNVSRHRDPSRPTNSIALLKYLPLSKNKFLLAHSSAGYYSDMLRIQKKYNFSFHETGASHSSLVPGNTIIFTSYPASLHSQDDFYQIYGTTNMSIAGSSMKNFNWSLWEVAELDKVFMGPRVAASNRLAKSSEQWAHYLTKNHSGTGNKQWLVIEANEKPSLWIVEQMPGITVSQDVTSLWHTQTYWASYGLPYFEEIKNISGYTENGTAKPLVDNIKSVQTVLMEGQKNITNDKDLFKLMRRPEITVVGRSDIMVINISKDSIDHIVGDTGFSTNYDPYANHSKTDSEKETEMNSGDGQHNGFHDVFQDMIDYKGIKDRLRGGRKRVVNNVHRIKAKSNQDSNLIFKEPEGIIDLKISLGQETFEATAGPPYTDLSGNVRVEPFQWSRSSAAKVPHYGQSDIWNFQPTSPIWIW